MNDGPEFPQSNADDSPPKAFRDILSDAIRYWEHRRIVYNLILALVVVGWLALSWPHFRSSITFESLLAIMVPAVLANICYCAAYVVDVPLQYSLNSAVLDSQALEPLVRWDVVCRAARQLLDCRRDLSVRSLMLSPAAAHCVCGEVRLFSRAISRALMTTRVAVLVSEYCANSSAVAHATSVTSLPGRASPLTHSQR